MVIAPVVGGRELTLRIDRTPELAAPDDQCVVQQPALFEVLDQGSGWLIGVTTLALDLSGQVAVLVPPHVIELNEADATLGEPARQQAVGGVAAGLQDVRSVKVEDRRRLADKVGELGHRRLHAIAQLVLGDAREDLGVAGQCVVQVVERGDLVEHLPSRAARAAGGVGEVKHRLLAAAELDPLVARRQKTAAPETVVERLVGAPAREQHHECRQVLILAA